jgi:antitoxin CcdA
MATTARSPEKATFRMTREELIEAAGYFGIDPSGLGTEALRTKVKQVGEAQWFEENRAAIEGWNRWVEKHGSPLDRYRTF